MALDTRGLASGFAQGFGLADNYYTRQEQGERAERGLKMQEEAFEMKKEDRQSAQQKDYLSSALYKINYADQLGYNEGDDISGMFDQEEIDALKSRPSLLNILGPEGDLVASRPDKIMDPNDPADVNDPDSIYAMNLLFANELEKGGGGKKRIQSMLPGPKQGHVVFDLGVTPDDGDEYFAPVTERRSADPDDPVKQIPIDLVLQKAAAAKQFRMNMSPGAKQRAAMLHAMITGQTPERTKGININGQLVNPETGEAMGDFRTPEQRGENTYGEPFKHPQLGWVQPGPDGQLKQMDPPGSSDKAPADVKTAEWMVANGIAGDLTEAYALVSTSKSNPASFISRYVSAAQRDQGEFDPDKKSMRELTAEAREVYNEITGLDYGQRPSEPKETPSSGGDQELETYPLGQELDLYPPDQEQLPADGSAVLQPDGSYSGRVNRNPEQAPKTPANPAPVAAVEHLRKNPQLAQQFQDKYGYLPEGF